MAAVAPAYAALVPPPGYYAAVGQKNKGASCPTPPPPFTDTLDFPSKYEGSGKSRDTLNEKSKLRYNMLAKQLSDMEKGTRKPDEKYMDMSTTNPPQCRLTW